MYFFKVHLLYTFSFFYSASSYTTFHTYPPPIPDLNVELIKICDMRNVKLSLYDTCLYMKPTTLLFLFDQRVEHVYYKLS